MTPHVLWWGEVIFLQNDLFIISTHNLFTILNRTTKNDREFIRIKDTVHASNKDNYFIPDIIDETPSAEDKIIIEQNLENLLKLIKKLKPHYQEVIQLRYFQEMSYKEISEEINEPMTNVKVKLLRARKLLAEIIQKKNNAK